MFDHPEAGKSHDAVDSTEDNLRDKAVADACSAEDRRTKVEEA